MFERGPDVSFSNCALPYHLSGMIEDADSLVLVDPEDFRTRYNIEARTNSEVIRIKRAEKKVVVRDLVKGDEYEESYDKLILSPGARPILPKSIQGIDRPNVFSIRNVVDIRRLNGYLVSKDIEQVAVIGGGFIGIEVAENLRLAGKKVTLIEALDQVMAPFDYEMAQILHKEIVDNGIHLILNDGLKAVHDGFVELQSGKRVEAGAVVMAIGVSPEVDLARDAGLLVGKTGGIKVDHNYQTKGYIRRGRCH